MRIYSSGWKFWKSIGFSFMKTATNATPVKSPLHKSWSWSWWSEEKWSFPLKISSARVTKSAKKTADLVAFTEEILNEKLPFLCTVLCYKVIFIRCKLAIEKRIEKNCYQHTQNLEKISQKPNWNPWKLPHRCI